MASVWSYVPVTMTGSGRDLLSSEESTVFILGVAWPPHTQCPCCLNEGPQSHKGKASACPESLPLRTCTSHPTLCTRVPRLRLGGVTGAPRFQPHCASSIVRHGAHTWVLLINGFRAQVRRGRNPKIRAAHRSAAQRPTAVQPGEWRLVFVMGLSCVFMAPTH